MVNIVPIQQLTFSPEARDSNVARLPAPAGAAGKFEQLMFLPESGLPNQSAVSGASSGLRQYMQQLSQRWNNGQSALERMAQAGQFTSKELVLTQVQMINCALDVEVSSKCASMFENGVQTLIQRGG